MYCIDASVLTNSEIEGEEFHEYSKEFMSKIKEEGITVIIPEIALPEIASAIARGSDDAEKALKFIKEMKQLPNVIFFISIMPEEVVSVRLETYKQRNAQEGI